jgi:hypothetical protein
MLVPPSGDGHRDRVDGRRGDTIAAKFCRFRADLPIALQFGRAKLAEIPREIHIGLPHLA